MISGGQHVPVPVFRPLRVFAVDPGATAGLATALSNEKILRVPWEHLAPGPSGEYVVVVDADEDGRHRYPPVDLDDPRILAQNGLAPSDGNPQFRQQMLYAVAMATIGSFETALGRVVLWRPLRGHAGSGPQYRRRLALRPHHFPRLEALYDPEAGACFGYALGQQGSPLERTLVFAGLSQDCIAWTMTRALLDGMGLDLDPADGGLSQAFPNVVALCQHFGDGEVLRAQLAAIRGDLDERNDLGVVAAQMGQAFGRTDGLRNALGHTDEHGQWQPWRPDPTLLGRPDGPAAGDVLLNAVFEGFKRIYSSRVADLRRIATQGSGVLPPGQPHPDLVARFSAEAARSASLVQQMCIRAVDYLPPVDIGFDDFVRAFVTADHDLYPADEQHYRTAMLDALRGYGIDAGRTTLTPDTLLWFPPPDGTGAAVTQFVQGLSRATTFWNLPQDRAALWRAREQWKRGLAAQLRSAGVPLGAVDVGKRFVVSAFDLRQRTGAGGALTLDWVIRVVQGPKGHRVGSTLIVDAQSGEIRYFIDKPARDAAEQDLLRYSQAVRTTTPGSRRLRVFATDPSLGTRLETAGVNEVTLGVRWERGGPGGVLGPGPTGEYVEVVDHDPASGCFYAPVDLDDPGIVSQDGLTPSESNPQFHQQMVYAVTMRVIADFERALGRRALWAPRLGAPTSAYGSSADGEEYVGRLRIHPHALREANAYYSPSKKALLFGYFPAVGDPASGGPALTVFTCVSQDIVAHEVTHALLDGIHQHFNEASNPDVLAFHEAFADLVALFGHFSLPEVLYQQIAATRGDLTAQNGLGELAQQFGQAIGRRGALRSAIGSVDPETGVWSPTRPDPTAYQRVVEPHDRGAILVAAVFGAFLTIYEARVADLLRIATQGTGVLPTGQVHPDLVGRLADEAAGAARGVLDMCIRALDYCPPVDLTFGDYLRALVTADFAADPVDERHDRVAFVESFRRYGIVPDGIRALSPDGLLWQPTSSAPDQDEDVVVSVVRRWAVDIDSWHLTQDRRQLFDLTCRLRLALHTHLEDERRGASRTLGGLDPAHPFEVHSVRPTVGTDWNGRPTLHWVIELIQSQRQYFDPAQDDGGEPDFIFRGGCTLVVDARSGKVRYSIVKRLDGARLRRQREYLLGVGAQSLAATYFGGPGAQHLEPFAMLHRG